MIYSGSFFNSHDKRLMRDVHSCRPEALATQLFSFNDKRLEEMLFRYRGRNYPETLNSDELERWEQFRSRRLLDESSSAGITFEVYQAMLKQWRQRPDLQSGELEILDQLDAWPIEIGIPGMISNT